MSDLISRLEVNDVIDELEVYTSGRPNTMKVEVSVLQLQRFINKLKNIPTAYDVDKVVEKLEEEKSMVPVNRVLDDITKDKPNELGQLIAYDKAINIVKAGGIINE